MRDWFCVSILLIAGGMFVCLVHCFAQESVEPDSPSKPEVWLCIFQPITDLLAPDADWPYVKQHLSGIKLYVDWINTAEPEHLAALVKLVEEQNLQIAVELGGCLDFSPMDETAGTWSANHELAKIKKLYDAGGKVDFLDIDGPVRRLLHPESRQDGKRFDSIEDAADQLVIALNLHRQTHPETQYWLLTNFPNWGWHDDVSYHARGSNRQDWGDYHRVVEIVLHKLDEADIPLEGVTVDNPYEYLIGEHSSVNLEDPASINWLERVREYEDYARSRGLKFNLIINSEHGGMQSDELFYTRTLNMLDAYLEAEGQPDRWFVQTWYPYPAQVVPETAPYSFTALVKSVMERVGQTG